MFKTGNRLRWAIGAFCLLSLMMLAYNGIKLSQLYDTPLIGASLESKLAKQKWNQLETLIAEKAEKDWSISIGRLIKDLPQTIRKVNKSISSQENQQVVRYKKKTLPEISGIILTSGTTKKSNAAVIIKGKIYTENDEVSGYMIKKITEDGVSLTKNGQRYFIDAPKARYSIDQGN